MDFTQQSEVSAKQILIPFLQHQSFYRGRLQIGELYAVSDPNLTINKRHRSGWTSLMSGITSV